MANKDFLLVKLFVLHQLFNFALFLSHYLCAQNVSKTFLIVEIIVL